MFYLCSDMFSAKAAYHKIDNVRFFTEVGAWSEGGGVCPIPLTRPPPPHPSDKTTTPLPSRPPFPPDQTTMPTLNRPSSPPTPLNQAPTSPRKQNDTCLWKHNLPPYSTYVVDNNIMVSQAGIVQSVGMIGLSFDTEVCRCHTRRESQGTCMSSASVNRAAHTEFETQRRHS